MESSKLKTNPSTKSSTKSTDFASEATKTCELIAATSSTSSSKPSSINASKGEGSYITSPKIEVTSSSNDVNGDLSKISSSMSNISNIDIVIDGSIGEGGGQVLRTALSLSCITGKSIKIINIRGKRPKPGLQKQHLVCVNAAMEIANAEVSGNYVDSMEICFSPGKIQASMLFMLFFYFCLLCDLYFIR